jgi:hypothetical protein
MSNMLDLLDLFNWIDRAEYLLLRAGAPVVTTFDHRNAAWASKHGGALPPAWRDRKDSR